MATENLSIVAKRSLGFLHNNEFEQDSSETSSPTNERPEILPKDNYSRMRSSFMRPGRGASAADTSASTTAVVKQSVSSVTAPPVFNLDHLIEKLSAYSQKPDSQPAQRQLLVSQNELINVCELSSKLLLAQPSLLELVPADNGLTVVGDLHGQLCALHTIFAQEGTPDVHNYLFLGNYVDYGEDQIELITLVLCYKLKYPENFFLLRGSHETSDLNKDEGFLKICQEVYGSDMPWHLFNRVFESMPVAAVVGDSIFCVHSGLSTDLQTTGNLRSIQRPVRIPANGLLYDLLHAQPTKETPGWDVSDKGDYMIFGSGVWNKFLRYNALEFMLRGRATSINGYSASTDKKVLSLTSAVNTEELLNREAGFAHISSDLTVQIYTFDKNGITRERRLNHHESRH
ncbi:hypothetical protein RvY_12735 [Ramazzottius varieornatus]|uniref:protein-serine/threonine phosphatase n=1 Tax=Ramazzottius varieornatus TaxID=947166 RepID=A0A1D1VPN3_RAMVA|nr:hypothetical protein RvY_12735 [Ramazzottius varieornatus]